MVKNRTKLILAILLLGTVGLYFRFMEGTGESQVQKSDLRPLRISLVDFPGLAYIYIADKKGYFLRNGVQVELVQKSENELRRMYKNREVDGTTEIFTDVISQAVEGIPFKVVYVIDYSNSGDAIVGRKDFTDLSHLKGHVKGVEISPQSPETHSSDSQYGPFFLDALL
jgi:ABC-type nitrate/sulfonate/bicarbonate transport system substrate-binding protein